MSLFRVAPFYYIHVLDNNTNVTRLVVGPQTFALQDHEKLVLMPTKMLVIPPEHYCIIGNPTTKTADGSVEVDKYNQVKLQHGDIELRFNDAWSQPFPLYPGEELQGAVDPMEVVPHDTALRLRVKRDFDDADADVSRVAGDEFHFHGPGTFKPRMEVEIGETVVASIILENHALKLRSRQGFTDNGGVERQAGEEWLVRTSGAYLPHVDEIVVSIVKPTVLPDDSALHLRATDTFTDVYGQQRNAGEEWLVTRERCELHLCDVYERIIGGVGLTVLNKLQYCIVLDPVDATGKNRYGSRELRQGDTHTSFFLQPGETLEAGIQVGDCVLFLIVRMLVLYLVVASIASHLFSTA
jgi:major vault protein